MRLSDADKLVARLNDLYEWCRDERRSGIEQAMCMVHEAPTVDAEPVVRCKDCEYFDSREITGYCYLSEDIWKPNDFCSYGKRRDGE
jgi:hypothetical protein